MAKPMIAPPEKHIAINFKVSASIITIRINNASHIIDIDIPPS